VDEVPAYIVAVGKHWMALLTGSGLAVAILLINTLTVWRLPRWTYILVFAGAVGLASLVKSQRCWIFETGTHSRSSATVDSGDSEIATHPAIVDLEPNAAMHLVALIAQREVFGPTSSISVRRLGPRARRERG